METKILIFIHVVWQIYGCPSKLYHFIKLKDDSYYMLNINFDIIYYPAFYLFFFSPRLDLDIEMDRENLDF